MKININLELTKSQKKAYDLIHQADTRYLVCRWSRQCGKSIFAEVMLLENLLTPNTFSAYISPTFSQGRKVFKEMVRLLNQSGLVKNANASTLTIETVINSTLQFFSMDSATAIRGYTVTGILVLDEAAFFPDALPNGDEPWGSVIYPITKAHRPKVLIISTPKGKRGLFYDFYAKAQQHKKGYKEITADIYADDLITAEEIEEIKSQISDYAFREEFLVEFIDGSSTFFVGNGNCFKDLGTINFEKTWIGVDLSGDGADETIVTKINQDNEVEQFKIIGSLDDKYQKIAKLINESVNLQSAYLEQNGLGSPMINEIEKLVDKPNKIERWTTTNSTKEAIIGDLAVAIANKDISFQNSDNELRRQLNAFSVTHTKTGKLQFAGGHNERDDRVMSLAIALRCKNDNVSVGNYTFRLI